MAGALPICTFGRTGLEVTRLGFGAMEIRGSRIWRGREVTSQQAQTILNAVLDGGVNFIDTANDYGLSEEFIGKFISKRREEYFLATKCGCTVVRKDANTDDTPHVWTRENLFRCLEESLARMKTNYVDVMQLHNPTFEQCVQNNLVGALDEMKQQGKVRFIGCSTTLPVAPAFIEWGVFDVFQIPYSALERKHEMILARAANSEAGVIVRGGVARGEQGVGLGAPDRWKNFEHAQLDELREEGESRTAFLLRFILSNPDIHTTIVGTMKPEHLQENVEAAKRGALSDEIYTEAKRRLEAVGEKPADA